MLYDCKDICTLSSMYAQPLPKPPLIRYSLRVKRNFMLREDFFKMSRKDFDKIFSREPIHFDADYIPPKFNGRLPVSLEARKQLFLAAPDLGEEIVQRFLGQLLEAARVNLAKYTRTTLTAEELASDFNISRWAENWVARFFNKAVLQPTSLDRVNSVDIYTVQKHFLMWYMLHSYLLLLSK